MGCDRGRSHGFLSAMCRGKVAPGVPVLVRGMVALILAGPVPTAASAQQSATAAPLVFDGVTVIDVENGRRLPAQRVMIVGTRIQAVGPANKTPIPTGAQVVDARGKYLIPGLWDMHSHGGGGADYIVNGVTGTRDAGFPLRASLQSGVRRRQAILAGTAVGPRMVLAGPLIQVQTTTAFRRPMEDLVDLGLLREEERQYLDSLARAMGPQNSRRVREILDSFLLAKGRVGPLIDSLKAGGADFIKLRLVSSTMYFAFAAEARRRGMLIGGHAQEVSVLAASDSGARIIDHVNAGGNDELLVHCLGRTQSATVERCRPLAERLRRNGTWWVPTLVVYKWDDWVKEKDERIAAIRRGIRRELRCEHRPRCTADSLGLLSIAHRAGMPILAGTDQGADKIHTELAIFVEEGLTPLAALQSATLNPAKMLRGTDSLGTVARGKLADLVLLDADPLADITNTTTIRAVVANGRYFDRAALDQIK